MLQVWGSADFVFNIGYVLQVWGSADFVFNIGYVCYSYVVGPCHHGMARPQVADRGTASDKEGSCE